jgi:hypothetical protein
MLAMGWDTNSPGDTEGPCPGSHLVSSFMSYSVLSILCIWNRQLFSMPQNVANRESLQERTHCLAMRMVISLWHPAVISSISASAFELTSCSLLDDFGYWLSLTMVRGSAQANLTRNPCSWGPWWAGRDFVGFIQQFQLLLPNLSSLPFWSHIELTNKYFALLSLLSIQFQRC